VRIWSLHPAYLDRAGLTAVWREGLLAQAVLAGRTRGYTRHPQLDRFRAVDDPLGAIAAYLDAVRDEAAGRGYSFDPARIDSVPRRRATLSVTSGQLAFEAEHLRAKVLLRAPDFRSALPWSPLVPHPLLELVDGPVADWERVPSAGGRQDVVPTDNR